MSRDTNALPQELATIIWRIIGNDESPLKQETTSRLIERTIRKYARHVSLARQDQAIAAVHAWFEFHGEKGWLKEDMREAVAQHIVNGVRAILSSQAGIQNNETAFCAVGSIEPDVALRIIGRSLSNEELDEFVGYSFKTLGSLCDKDAVLNPDMHIRLDGARAKVSLNDKQRERRLETLWRLRDHDWWLHSSVANMVELLVKLKADHFYTLVEEIDNPVIHLRAARCLIAEYAPSDFHTPLRWLSESSSDELIALGIVHILEEVNRLDSDLRQDTGSKDEKEDLEMTASCLLSNMVEQLDRLEPNPRAHWIGELLSDGIAALNSHGRSEKPRRVEQLEESCVQQMTCLVRQSWSEDLFDEFRVGMCLTPLVPRTLPLAQVALHVRETDPERSAEIARLILDDFVQQVAETLDCNGTFSYDLRYWTYCDWVNGLGIALALSDAGIDLPEWVSEGCRALPLSAWDAEEDFQRFLTAEKVAQFRFLVALYAIQVRIDIGYVVDPAAPTALAEGLWAHCRFVQTYLQRTEGSDVAEYAARVAVLLGKPSADWVLEQAMNRGVGPRTLWALIDQEPSNGAQGSGLWGDRQLMVVAELRRIASSRFGDVRGMNVTELRYLGELWLLLSAVDEARKTAMAIVSLPQPKLDRVHRIIALKLLAFAAGQGRLDREAEKEIAPLYSDLWTSYTPPEERVDRQQIDAFLKL